MRYKGLLVNTSTNRLSVVNNIYDYEIHYKRE
jgi:hypothetical protein